MWFKQKPLPVYCGGCGCKMLEYWWERPPVFNEMTGRGTRVDERHWVCPNRHEDSSRTIHTWIDQKETRVVEVTATCAALFK